MDGHEPEKEQPPAVDRCQEQLEERKLAATVRIGDRYAQSQPVE
jgi:hypothetical protein